MKTIKIMYNSQRCENNSRRWLPNTEAPYSNLFHLLLSIYFQFNVEPYHTTSSLLQGNFACCVYDRLNITDVLFNPLTPMT